MSAATPLTVTAAGLVCSVGLSAPAACAAIRGGLDNFFETEFVDRRGEPLAGGRIPWPDPDLLATVRVGGIQRLSRLFALAARECAREAGGIDTRRTPCWMLETSKVNS